MRQQLRQLGGAQVAALDQQHTELAAIVLLQREHLVQPMLPDEPPLHQELAQALSACVHGSCSMVARSPAKMHRANHRPVAARPLLPHCQDCRIVLQWTLGMTMAKLSTWSVGTLCWGLLACGHASLRELETPRGKAIEIRCQDAKYCRQRTQQLSCQRGVKQVHALDDTHLVVTCSRRVTPELTNAHEEPSPVDYDYALNERAPSERDGASRFVRPNATMFMAAERVAAIEQQAHEELLAVRADLKAKCRAGGLNDCLVELDLSPWSALPTCGEPPARDHRVLRERARDLLALCKRRHAPACHRLGELAHVLAGG